MIMKSQLSKAELDQCTEALNRLDALMNDMFGDDPDQPSPAWVMLRAGQAAAVDSLPCKTHRSSDDVVGWVLLSNTPNPKFKPDCGE